MKRKSIIKHIFLYNNNWKRFLNQFSHRIRQDIVITIDKFLKCCETIVGYNHYKCSNSDCGFTKKIAFTCKCKACSSCGRKSIEVWMVDNTNMISNTLHHGNISHFLCLIYYGSSSGVIEFI